MQMDKKAKKKQSLRAKRQTMPRKPGIVSLQPKPIDEFGTGFGDIPRLNIACFDLNKHWPWAKSCI